MLESCSLNKILFMFDKSSEKLNKSDKIVNLFNTKLCIVPNSKVIILVYSSNPMQIDLH